MRVGSNTFRASIWSSISLTVSKAFVMSASGVINRWTLSIYLMLLIAHIITVSGDKCCVSSRWVDTLSAYAASTSYTSGVEVTTIHCLPECGIATECLIITGDIVEFWTSKGNSFVLTP